MTSSAQNTVSLSKKVALYQNLPTLDAMEKNFYNELHYEHYSVHYETLDHDDPDFDCEFL